MLKTAHLAEIADLPQGKDAIFEGRGTAVQDWHGIFGSAPPEGYYVGVGGPKTVAPSTDFGMLSKIAVGAPQDVSFTAVLCGLSVVEKVEVQPKVRVEKTEILPTPPQLREVRPAPELYPDLDLDRIRVRVEELRTASSDSEAVSLVLGRSVQIVHQAE